MRSCITQGYRYIDGIELLGELNQAAEVRDCVALSNYPIWFEVLEERLRLSRYLRHSYVFYQLGLRKPDPEIYLAVLEHLGVAAQRCIFIDDRHENCEAANALGMTGLLFTDVSALRAEPPHLPFCELLCCHRSNSLSKHVVVSVGGCQTRASAKLSLLMPARRVHILSLQQSTRPLMMLVRRCQQFWYPSTAPSPEEGSCFAMMVWPWEGRLMVLQIAQAVGQCCSFLTEIVGFAINPIFFGEFLSSHGLWWQPRSCWQHFLDWDESRMSEMVFRRPDDIQRSYELLLTDAELQDCIDEASGYAIAGHSLWQLHERGSQWCCD